MSRLILFVAAIAAASVSFAQIPYTINGTLCQSSSPTTCMAVTGNVTGTPVPASAPVPPPLPPVLPPIPVYTPCAVNGNTCSFSGTQIVVFGMTPATPYATKTFTNGTLCSAGAFGVASVPDQSPSCWIVTGGSAAPPITPANPVMTISGDSLTTINGEPVTTVVKAADAPASSPVPASTPATVPPAPVPTPVPDPVPVVNAPPPVPSLAGTVSCAAPTVTATQTPNGLISAETADPNTLRVFPILTPFNVAITTTAAQADTVLWTMKDALGNVKANGAFPVTSGAQTRTLSCQSGVAGYLALSATLKNEGGALPQRGTEPAGVQSFGILPGQVVPSVTYDFPDQHRFGVQGFNGRATALKSLGATWTITNAQQSALEPNGANTFAPNLTLFDGFYVANKWNVPLFRLDGIPGWNSSNGQPNDSYSLPTNLSEYGSYMGKVGTYTSAIHAAYYPTNRNDYFQVTWEPSLQWPQSNSAPFLQLYKTVYTALHSTNPKALVMGPAEPFANNNGASSGGRLLATPGLCQYLDGVTTHAYYNAPTVPSNPPELQDGNPVSYLNALDNEMSGLRATMQACKPNMPLWNTELGISYDSGVSYAAVTSNMLAAQAAVAARSHIIILGEGAQVTFYFYGGDFPDNLAGYGTFFDLSNAQGQYGATNLAPKPEAMALSALSRILDGTNTLGPLNLPACVAANGCVHGFAFQQLKQGAVITALWVHKNAQWTQGNYSFSYSTPYSLAVDGPGTSGNVKVLDMYGNATTAPYANGIANLTLTESPIYVISSNASVTKSLVTAPLGYVGQ